MKRRRLCSYLVAVAAAGCSNPVTPAPTGADASVRDVAKTPDAVGSDAESVRDAVDDLRADVPTTATPRAVWTNRYDNARSGATLTETQLSVAAVSSSRFGLLFSREVEGQIYAQPLYVPSVTVPGRGTRNVVFVATEHDMVYAFDADDPAASEPLWTADLGPAVPAADIMTAGECHNLEPEIGITATPVIDLASNTLYVLAKTREDGAYHHRLHALDLRTGRDREGSPVDVGGEVPGTGNGTHDGVVTLDPLWTHARVGLALAGGVVYTTFASHCDHEAYHGWIVAYDAATLRRRAVFNSTPDGANGGIWQSGVAPSIDDSGDLYVTVGDGTATPTTNPPQLGNSVARLRLGADRFTVVDFFTPYNQAELFRLDMDLGSTGVLLVPHTSYALVGSKQGYLYLLDRGAMGHFHEGDDSQIVQSLFATHHGDNFNIHGTPVYWDSPAGPRVYIWAEEDTLKAYAFDGHRLSAAPVAQSGMHAPPGMPGGIITLSASGSAAGSGVLWASLPLEGDAVEATVPGVLRAFDAEDPAHELWSSTARDEDGVGNFAKFCPPVVVNGRVYLATFSNRLNVYGLR